MVFHTHNFLPRKKKANKQIFTKGRLRRSAFKRSVLHKLISSDLPGNLSYNVGMLVAKMFETKKKNHSWRRANFIRAVGPETTSTKRSLDDLESNEKGRILKTWFLELALPKTISFSSYFLVLRRLHFYAIVQIRYPVIFTVYSHEIIALFYRCIIKFISTPWFNVKGSRVIMTRYANVCFAIQGGQLSMVTTYDVIYLYGRYINPPSWIFWCPIDNLNQTQINWNK